MLHIGVFFCAMFLLNPFLSNSFVKRAPIGRTGGGLARLLAMRAGSTVDPEVMPITVLSGFLGAGKTTFLQHAVTNADGLKYGLVVNDMATVNVDSKLIKKQTTGDFDGIDTMELQNGCVCCTLAEDMMASVSRLVQLAEAKQEPYDHIIVECSGIAEPRKIRDLFQEAADFNMPLLRKIKLDTLVTLVDATVFMEYFGSDSEIGVNPTLALPDNEETMDRAMVESRKVTDLLLEQVECADMVLINKVDLLEDASTQLPILEKVIRSMNPTAVVKTCERGSVMPRQVLGTAKGVGAADWGILDEHRKMVQAVKAKSDCDEPTCTDSSHDHHHAHAHAHGHDERETCSDPKCTDPSHSHAHDHSHESSSSDCSDPTCTDPTHDHDHDHDHDHSHSHGHTHEPEEMTTARERFGITSFVYSRRRPFHPTRMSQFLQGLGKLSVAGMDDVLGHGMASTSKAAVTSDESNAVTKMKAGAKSLLRSKGFVWIATSRSAAYFMSHAGQYLEMVVLGRWWADIPEAEWPDGAEDEIMVDYDAAAPAHGDRRQELVFIGQFAGEGEREKLEEVLDTCLLTDEEFAEYERVAPRGDEALRELFFSSRSAA